MHEKQSRKYLPILCSLYFETILDVISLAHDRPGLFPSILLVFNMCSRLDIVHSQEW
jgi:hypothetical protein